MLESNTHFKSGGGVSAASESIVRAAAPIPCCEGPVPSRRRARPRGPKKASILPPLYGGGGARIGFQVPYYRWSRSRGREFRTPHWHSRAFATGRVRMARKPELAARCLLPVTVAGPCQPEWAASPASPPVTHRKQRLSPVHGAASRFAKLKVQAVWRATDRRDGQAAVGQGTTENASVEERDAQLKLSRQGRLKSQRNWFLSCSVVSISNRTVASVSIVLNLYNWS